MDFRILGPLEVWDDDRRLAIGGPRHRRLLTALILEADRVVPSDQLANVLWSGDPPASASASIHVRVSELRKALGSKADEVSPILTTDRGYRLRVDAADLDSARFQELAASGERALTAGHLEAAVDTLSAALALWRGTPYVDLGDDPAAEAEIARLRSLRTTVEDNILEARLQTGEHARVAAELSALVIQTPWAERRWALLMLAHYRCGRQGEALATFATARERLVDDLGIEPGVDLRRMHEDILSQAAHLEPVTPPRDTRPSMPTVTSNVPSRLASFVGRISDLEILEQSLLDTRLVTVTGSGGIGKTSLAREVAARSADRYPGGIWFVQLAAIEDPDLVATTIATPIGLKEQPGTDLVAQIAHRVDQAPSLLVLDNCEHLITTTRTVVDALLQRTVRLRVLATSRERLGTSGERVHRLGGLGLPETGRDHLPTDVGLSEAALLWIDRATAVQSDFTLDDRTAPHVARICRRLDGLPLALELSAAVISALDVEEIAARVDDRLELLDRGRHRPEDRHGSLSSLVDWSYTRLAPAEQRAFEQISVFHGPFSLLSAEEVCRASDDSTSIAALLWRLVDTSMLTSETVDGARRYRLLDVVRDYSLRRLCEREEQNLFRQRHALHFLHLAEAAGAALRGPDQSYWVSVLEREHSNLRAAMEWFIKDGEVDSVTRLAGSIYAFWDRAGHYEEGRRWLTRALALPEGAPGSRARALMGSATLAVIHGDLPSAAAICAEVIELSRVSADYEALAHALQFCGLAAIFAGDLDTADRVISESLRAARFAGQVWLEGWGLEFQAAIALARGAYEQVVELAGRSVEVSRPHGDPECVAWALVTLATASIAQGQITAAVASLSESLRSFGYLGGSWGLSLAIFDCAQLAERRGDHRLATRLLAASEQLRTAARAGRLPSIQAAYERCVSSCSAALDPRAYATTWAQGEAESSDQTLTRAAEILAQIASEEPEADRKES